MSGHRPGVDHAFKFKSKADASATRAAFFNGLENKTIDVSASTPPIASDVYQIKEQFGKGDQGEGAHEPSARSSK